MKFKKIVVIISILCFFLAWFLILNKLGKSLSPLGDLDFKQANNTTNYIHDDFKLLLSNECILDGEKLFTTSSLTNQSSPDYIPGYVDIINKRFIPFEAENKKYYSISGISEVGDELMLLYKQTDERAYSFLYIKNDSSIFEIPSIPKVEHNNLTAMKIVENRPEVVVITDENQYNKEFKIYYWNFTEHAWKEKEFTKNSFFLRNITPVTAFYNDGWHLVTITRLIEKGDMYGLLGENTTTIMTFRNNLSNPVHSQTVEKNLFKNKVIFNVMNTGLLSDINCNKPMYIFSITDTVYLEVDCHCDLSLGEFGYIYNLKNNIISPLCQYTISENDDNLRKMIIDNKDSLIIEFEKTDGKYYFNRIIRNNKLAIAETNNLISEFVIIPHDDKKIIFTDNGKYLVLNKSFIVTNPYTLAEKIYGLGYTMLSEIKENPKNFTTYTLPAFFFLLPLLLVLSFFMFAVSKTFYNPKHTYSVTRKKKKKTTSNFIFVPSLIYLVLYLIFLTDFIATLKIM